MGNITRDPELKYTPKGTAIADFALAINRKWKAESGEMREEATFVGCVAFGRVAEIIGEYCRKGNPLYVEGRLTQETWDDKTSGDDAKPSARDLLEQADQAVHQVCRA